MTKIKSCDSVKAVSDRIVELSKTKGGDLLVRVNLKSQNIAPLLEALNEAMGNEAVANHLVQYQKVVIQDLDEQSEEVEILEAISGITSVPPNAARVTTFMSMSKCQKWVIISLTVTAAHEVQKSGRVRVGYVNCRVRAWEDRGRKRCPKCLAEGNGCSTCKGPNRSNCCRKCGKCGESGHQGVMCSATEDKKAVFIEQLQNESTEANATTTRSLETEVLADQ